MSKINTIIFDLGGVILNLDQGRTIRSFQRLGADLEDIHLHSPLFEEFETGHVTESEFRKGILASIRKPMLDEQIDAAWNAMLLDLPEARITFIEKLKKQFKVGLLSNTNSIHIKYFHHYLEEQGLLNRWNNLFDDRIYSYETGLRKPDVAIYQLAADRIHTGSEQCLFIDDNISNLKGAEKVGMKVMHAIEPIGPHSMEEIRKVMNSNL